MRDCVVQVWLLFMNDAGPMPARNVSTSPSSSVVRRISRPHSAPMIRPASVEPVTAISSTSGWLTREEPAFSAREHDVEHARG